MKWLNPTLLPAGPLGKANGAALIAAPGGGFRVLSYKNEGTRIAEWFVERGVTVFVLKYRLHRMPDDLGKSLIAGGMPGGPFIMSNTKEYWT